MSAKSEMTSVTFKAKTQKRNVVRRVRNIRK